MRIGPNGNYGEKTSIKKTKEKAVTKPKQTKSTGDLSKDEATIKRLKSFVLACGVRKPWAKVFKDYPHPSQQIKKLKEILAELGMTGRLSMEQAKRIKAQRELAQELEDVRSFEQSVLSRSSRSRTTSAARPVKSEESEDEESDEEVQPRRKQAKNKALQSINAFLEDQSDED
ncbi:putative transcriptional regulator [Lyophyllum shimeji]|uniref:Transcriptional regulator n=1 Tax=Lyophyllum shimeji TaxID=47721 RepID=A0A9P3PWH8_LYOSH|nr:putative transcriptional regulator [Lyophyllum shimeji]